MLGIYFLTSMTKKSSHMKIFSQLLLIIYCCGYFTLTMAQAESKWTQLRTRVSH